MLLLAHAADFFMALPVLAFLLWLGVTAARERLRECKDRRSKPRPAGQPPRR